MELGAHPSIALSRNISRAALGVHEPLLEALGNNFLPCSAALDGQMMEGLTSSLTKSSFSQIQPRQLRTCQRHSPLLHLRL